MELNFFVQLLNIENEKKKHWYQRRVVRSHFIYIDDVRVMLIHWKKCDQNNLACGKNYTEAIKECSGAIIRPLVHSKRTMQYQAKVNVTSLKLTTESRRKNIKSRKSSKKWSYLLIFRNQKNLRIKKKISKIVN